MARYTGPVWKKARRLSFSVLETGEELRRGHMLPDSMVPQSVSSSAVTAPSFVRSRESATCTASTNVSSTTHS